MPKCDHCSKKAVRNYQRIWHIFDITRSGGYTNERADCDIEEPIEENNLHLCKEHEAAFLAGEF